MRNALATWHMGRVIDAYRHHPWHGQVLRQSVVGNWFGLTQTQLSRIESGRAPEEMSKLVRWAKLLGIPPELLWFKMPGDGSTSLAKAPVVAAQGAGGPAWPVVPHGWPSDMTDVNRALDEVAGHAIQFSQCSTTAGTVDLLDEQVRSLARDYLTMAPLPVIQEAAGISRRIYGMLTQRQRLRDARELHIIAAKVHALLSWAASDLGRLPVAAVHGQMALALAEEADHPGTASLALCALSKTAFWGLQARAAADFAQRGFESSPANTTRALLSCQVADAASGTLGVAAINAAHDALDTAVVDDDLSGVFGCSSTRVINYSIGAFLKAGDPEGALRIAEQATSQLPGEQVGYGTLAQIGIGRARARLIQHDFPGAAREVAPVLALPPERRLVTLSGKLMELAAACEAAAMAGAGADAVMFAGDIRAYCKQNVASGLAAKGIQ
jgi:transcriptional regulator with XRE-family HTH domain